MVIRQLGPFVMASSGSLIINGVDWLALSSSANASNLLNLTVFRLSLKPKTYAVPSNKGAFQCL